jgi:hypothetical protein
MPVLYVHPVGAFDIDWQIRILFIVIVGDAGRLGDACRQASEIPHGSLAKIHSNVTRPI